MCIFWHSFSWEHAFYGSCVASILKEQSYNKHLNDLQNHSHGESFTMCYESGTLFRIHIWVLYYFKTTYYGCKYGSVVAVTLIWGSPSPFSNLLGLTEWLNAVHISNGISYCAMIRCILP